MKLSRNERETLIGPAAVGIVMGVFFAVCTVAFNSEYKPAASSEWSTISDVVLGFFGGLLLAFLPFGLAPVLIGRLSSSAGSKSR
jgi:RsiW-degrading membrane proteinase PrsW (M82 family)